MSKKRFRRSKEANGNRSRFSIFILLFIIIVILIAAISSPRLLTRADESPDVPWFGFQLGDQFALQLLRAIGFNKASSVSNRCSLNGVIQPVNSEVVVDCKQKKCRLCYYFDETTSHPDAPVIDWLDDRTCSDNTYKQRCPQQPEYESTCYTQSGGSTPEPPGSEFFSKCENTTAICQRCIVTKKGLAYDWYGWSNVQCTQLTNINRCPTPPPQIFIPAISRMPFECNAGQVVTVESCGAYPYIQNAKCKLCRDGYWLKDTTNSPLLLNCNQTNQWEQNIESIITEQCGVMPATVRDPQPFIAAPTPTPFIPPTCDGCLHNGQCYRVNNKCFIPGIRLPFEKCDITTDLPCVDGVRYWCFSDGRFEKGTHSC